MAKCLRLSGIVVLSFGFGQLYAQEDGRKRQPTEVRQSLFAGLEDYRHVSIETTSAYWIDGGPEARPEDLFKAKPKPLDEEHLKVLDPSSFQWEDSEYLDGLQGIEAEVVFADASVVDRAISLLELSLAQVTDDDVYVGDFIKQLLRLLGKIDAESARQKLLAVANMAELGPDLRALAAIHLVKNEQRFGAVSTGTLTAIAQIIEDCLPHIDARVYNDHEAATRDMLELLGAIDAEAARHQLRQLIRDAPFDRLTKGTAVESLVTNEQEFDSQNKKTVALLEELIATSYPFARPIRQTNAVAFSDWEFMLHDQLRLYSGVREKVDEFYWNLAANSATRTGAFMRSSERLVAMYQEAVHRDPAYAQELLRRIAPLLEARRTSLAFYYEQYNYRIQRADYLAAIAAMDFTELVVTLSEAKRYKKPQGYSGPPKSEPNIDFESPYHLTFRQHYRVRYESLTTEAEPAYHRILRILIEPGETLVELGLLVALMDVMGTKDKLLATFDVRDEEDSLPTLPEALALYLKYEYGNLLPDDILESLLDLFSEPKRRQDDRLLPLRDVAVSKVVYDLRHESPTWRDVEDNFKHLFELVGKDTDPPLATSAYFSLRVAMAIALERSLWNAELLGLELGMLENGKELVRLDVAGPKPLKPALIECLDSAVEFDQNRPANSTVVPLVDVPIDLPIGLASHFDPLPVESQTHLANLLNNLLKPQVLDIETVDGPSIETVTEMLPPPPSARPLNSEAREALHETLLALEMTWSETLARVDKRSR